MTETSMMFKTPIEPTSNETAATAAVNNVKMRRIWLNLATQAVLISIDDPHGDFGCRLKEPELN